MRTIAMINQKGGCGKTTTAINTAAAFATLGYRTLLVDLDPQGHACMGLGIDPDNLTPTIYEALVDPDLPLVDVILNTRIEWLDLVPCNVLLAGAEMELAGVVGKELTLASKLRMLRQRYSVCIIDSPPSLGILTLNSLVASTDVVVPVQVHYFALEGLKRLLETIRIIRNRFHPCSSEVLGLLLTFVEDGTLFSRQIQQKMREFFGALVFDTVIHKTIRLAEAPSAGESILTYAPESRGASDYLSLAKEILANPVWAEEVGNAKT
ncbi:MAG: ParA family protein [Sedimentisphaerales bacterium]|nr:ParA family protein [Sedimentisphaerales bacterium]